MEEELMTRWEVSKRCGLSEYQITKLVKQGELPAYRLGASRNAHLRFKKGDVESWLEKNLVPAR